MNRSISIAAPTLIVTESLYELWHSEHHGSKADMVRWLAVPSLQRERFLSLLGSQRVELSGVVVETFSYGNRE